MVGWLAGRIGCRPAWVVGVWVGVAAVVTALAPSAERVAEVEPTAFLPADEPYQVAMAVERRAFPQIAARSRTVIIFERATGLTEADHAHIARVADRLTARGAEHAGSVGGRWRVLSPTGQIFLRSRLVSTDRKAAMIVVSTDTNWVTHAGKLEVETIARTVDAIPRPAGLTVEITGQGGMGRDLGAAGERALRRTTWVTVSVVLLILLVVYRSPLAALVPLLSIGLTVFVTLRVLDILSLAGWSVGTMERTFAVVLIYGSGTDFAMFWIARFRELVEERSPRGPATWDDTVQPRRGASSRALAATVAVAPAIMASAGTTVAGLSMLTLADFLPSRNAGRVLAIALSLSLIAALTLIPAVARLMGDWLFWPKVAGDHRNTSRRRWRWVANLAIRRPMVTVSATLAMLCWPLASGLGMTFRYDGLGAAPPGTSSARGQAIAARHFSAAQLFSWSMLLDTSSGSADGMAEPIADAIRRTPGVANVWSLGAPLGRKSQSGVPMALLRAQARPYYRSQDGHTLRFEVMQTAAPYSNEAMRSFNEAITAVRALVAESPLPGARVYAGGMTPYIVNIKEVTDRDHRRVTIGVVGVILIILIVWIRRLVLPVVMLATTLVVYYATLGISQAVLHAWFDVDGIDWKVRLILFVILVAVGQDFNIFLVSRILQEERKHDTRAAVWRGVVRTGPVISSCGLIVAATFGSLTAAGLTLYRELGVAFAVGVLMFTFVIRPIVIPGLYLMVRFRRVSTVDSAGVLT